METSLVTQQLTALARYVREPRVKRIRPNSHTEAKREIKVQLAEVMA